MGKGKKRHGASKGKTSGIAHILSQGRIEPEFRIDKNRYPRKIVEQEHFEKIQQQLTQLLAMGINAQEEKTRGDTLKELLDLLVSVTTGIWRARKKLLSQDQQEPPEEIRKAFRAVDSTYQTLIQAGVEIVDRTNEPYINGLTERVIAFQPITGLEKEMILETIKPSIQYKNDLLQQGEIIVGKPA